ncbi:MAG TPA: Na+/H+ antiporter NhaA, partial [Kofleriaceae bacterium]|nr:Na+/H+ antiporter NhaA [Kofleriaceae bacterium]
MSPVQRFLEVEAAGGIVLVIATAIAVAWANSPWASSYRALWRGDLLFAIDDVLMTIFFFVVGMELRRERPTALPFFAALGGMLVPAAIYAAINAGRAGAAGWGVPMATDIAFAVGVLTLLGARVAPGVRVLLLGLAVIDDVGAIIVIACFYSAGVGALGLAIAG